MAPSFPCTMLLSFIVLIYLSLSASISSTMAQSPVNPFVDYVVNNNPNPSINGTIPANGVIRIPLYSDYRFTTQGQDTGNTILPFLVIYVNASNSITGSVQANNHILSRLDTPTPTSIYRTYTLYPYLNSLPAFCDGGMFIPTIFVLMIIMIAMLW